MKKKNPRENCTKALCECLDIQGRFNEDSRTNAPAR